MTVSSAPRAPIATASRVTAETVRGAIARCVLGDAGRCGGRIPARLGSIRLRPHQLDAAVRLQQLMDESGGAMLADEVGLGKTYVALALSRAAQCTVVVGPAALQSMWRAALGRIGQQATFISFERLSRGGDRAEAIGSVDPDIVIVDEAHHVRTPTTRRHAALARLCARAHVLLLSATPLQNRRRDLAAQLSLFLGARVWTMSDAELTRHVVRRTRADVRADTLSPPTVAEPVWIELATSDDCLDMLLGLPPPVPPSDGGDGGALLVYSLVRRWASSRAALRGTLRRRLARAASLTAMLEHGRHPSRAEVSAWTYAEGSVQLAFPEIVAASLEPASVTDRDSNPAALLATVRAHEAAVRTLLQTIDATADPDVERADAIRRIRLRHPGERVIAFAEAAETVDALFRHLRADPCVAMLSARGAAVSGGTITRREALARFAPVAQGARTPHAAERVDLLLATDLLSEGVNLQDASIVVHLDLPWNPARLEQRVGRVSRLGSPHERVAVYAIRPPVAAERLLAVEQRLRAKLATAARSLGVVGTILPSLHVAPPGGRGAAEDWTRLHSLLEEWRSATTTPVDRELPLQVAAVRAPVAGFIAAVSGFATPTLLASVDGSTPSDLPRDVAPVMELASGIDAPVDDVASVRAIEAVDGWMSRHAATELSGLDLGDVARARRRVLARIDRIGSRAPRHARSIVAALVCDARRAALMQLGEGAERVLSELADASLADQAWLRAVAAFGELHTRRRPSASEHAGMPRLVAVLLLVRS